MAGFLVYDLALEKHADTEEARGNYQGRGYDLVVEQSVNGQREV